MAHYHFNYPYYPAAWQEEDAGGTPIPNGCVTQGRNGAVYGYDSSVPIGANTPAALPSGQAIYANYWLSDGTFIMRFGTIGNEPIPDVEFIFTSINGTLLQYTWDIVELRYQASNLTLATQLIADYVPDEDVCYTALPILQKMISYDMNITDVDGTNTLINNTSYSPHFNAPVINATQNGPGSILVDGTTDIDTGFKPNIGQYSIEETVTGNLEDLIDGVGQGTFTQRTEQRLLTHDGNVLGNNMCLNPDFITDVSDTQGTYFDLAHSTDDGGVCVATSTNTRLDYSFRFFSSPNKEVGKRYLYTIRAKASFLGFMRSYNGSVFTGTVVEFTERDTYQDFEFEFEQLGTTFADQIYLGGTTGTGYELPEIGDTITFEHISMQEVSTQNKYYINGIEQATPALPDPDTIINLNDTPVIGYPDKIESREADFNVHSEILTPTLETVGQNLYPNFNMQNGSDIVQDVPTGTLPDGHTLAFNTANPCDAFYTTPDNIEYWYLFNMNHDPVRLVLQQTVGYGIFEVGKVYRYQADVRTVTAAPTGAELRAIHIAAAVELTIVDNDNAMIGENENYTLRWIDFMVTDSGIGRANFRHGVGVWDVLTTAQDTRNIAIYELGLSNDEIQITHNGEDVVHEREPVIE